jgi:PadR family transcriptional regulator PadR
MKKQRQPSRGKQERYIQPSILLALFDRPSYGYELIQTVQTYGFVKGQAPPGMMYRHLRQLEDDGLVSSQWNTEGSGPARRMYHLTGDGEEMLAAWIDFMERKAENLKNFVTQYMTVKGNKR